MEGLPRSDRGFGKTTVVRRVTSGVILALCFAGLLLAADLEKAAQQAVAAERFREARDLYMQLSEQDPANVDYLVWIGRLSDWLKDFATATRFYDRALARAPQNAEALVGKAYVLMWQQEFQVARELLLQAQRVTPNSTAVPLALARSYYYQGRDKKAREYVERVLTLDPENQEAEELKAQITLPETLEVRVGYGHDRFSLVSPASMGSVSVGYVGDRGQVSGHYERWNESSEKLNLGGLSFSRRFGDSLRLRGGATWAPGATVLAEQDLPPKTSPV